MCPGLRACRVLSTLQENQIAWGTLTTLEPNNTVDPGISLGHPSKLRQFEDGIPPTRICRTLSRVKT